MNEHSAVTLGDVLRRMGTDELREPVTRMSRYRVEGTVDVSSSGAVVIVDSKGRDALAPVVDGFIGKRVAVVVTLLPEG